MYEKSIKSKSNYSIEKYTDKYLLYQDFDNYYSFI